MDEKEVVCSKCNRITIIFQDSVLPGWLFKEPGWALVNYSYFCPKCNSGLKMENAEINGINDKNDKFRKERIS